MESVFQNPPEELAGFARSRGGLVGNHADAPARDRSLAYEYLDLLSECYAGSRNENGETFRLHAQNCGSGLRNALFAKPNGIPIILHDEGLMRLIDEVALLCAIAKFRDFDKFEPDRHFQLFAQKSWHGPGILDVYRTDATKSLVRLMEFESEQVRFTNVLTNFMLLFALSHEFTHAVNGHCILLDESNPLAFLGETSRCSLNGQEKWILVAEMSADYIALQHALSVSDKASFKLDEVATEEMMPWMLASLFLMMSYWFVEAFELSGQSLYSHELSELDPSLAWDRAHPMSTDRIALLLSSLRDNKFGTRFGYDNLSALTGEALSICLQAMPPMREKVAIEQIASHEAAFLDRAFRQKRYLAKESLEEFQEATRRYRFSKVGNIKWQ